VQTLHSLQIITNYIQRDEDDMNVFPSARTCQRIRSGYRERPARLEAGNDHLPISLAARRGQVRLLLQDRINEEEMPTIHNKNAIILRENQTSRDQSRGDFFLSEVVSLDFGLVGTVGTRVGAYIPAFYFHGSPGKS
jgi:hypothetical protein